MQFNVFLIFIIQYWTLSNIHFCIIFMKKYIVFGFILICLVVCGACYERSLLSGRMKFYLAYHIEASLPKNKDYIPIHAGRAVALEKSKDGVIKDLSWFEKNMRGDNTGDNISKRNRYYDEMTMIYWLYKNLDFNKEPSYIGVGHYRRFLRIYDYNEYDIVLPNPWFFDTNIYDHHVKAHGGKEITFAIKVVKEMHPEYAEAIDEYFAANKFFPCNLMLMKTSLFIEYGDWIFPILEKVYNNIDDKTSKSYRSVGWVAERLTGVFLHKKIKEGAKVNYTRIYRDPRKA